MKKWALALILAVIFLVGCGKTDSNNTTTAANTSQSVSYTIGDVTIVPGTDFADAESKLGDTVEYTEATSCYFDGMDKVFTYDGFEVRTYPTEDGDFVQDLCLSSDTYSTDKGITIGSSTQDVIDAYGDGYELNGKMYKYVMDGDKYIYFFIMDDAVKYFGYAIDAGNN